MSHSTDAARWKAQTVSTLIHEASIVVLQEITMTYEKTIGPPPSSGIARLGRFALFFATAGFAYPNVFSENMDLTKLDAQYQIKAEKPYSNH